MIAGNTDVLEYGFLRPREALTSPPRLTQYSSQTHLNDGLDSSLMLDLDTCLMLDLGPKSEAEDYLHTPPRYPSRHHFLPNSKRQANTRHTLLRVSHTVYSLASRHLYTDLTLTKENIIGVLVGFDGDSKRTTSPQWKRDLLALTKTLRLHNFQVLDEGLFSPCDELTFPNVCTLIVSSEVWYHCLPRYHGCYVGCACR